MTAWAQSRWSSVVAALTRLDEASREIILLADVVGVSQRELARRLNVPPRRVKGLLAQARSRLQRGQREQKP